MSLSDGFVSGSPEMSATAPAPAPTPTRRDEYPPTGGEHHWAKATRELRHRLAKEIPHEVLKELHRKSPARHLAIAARQFLILGAASAVSWMFPQPWIWIPAALVRSEERRVGKECSSR